MTLQNFNVLNDALRQYNKLSMEQMQNKVIDFIVKEIGNDLEDLLQYVTESELVDIITDALLEELDDLGKESTESAIIGCMVLGIFDEELYKWFKETIGYIKDLYKLETLADLETLSLIDIMKLHDMMYVDIMINFGVCDNNEYAKKVSGLIFERVQ